MSEEESMGANMLMSRNALYALMDAGESMLAYLIATEQASERAERWEAALETVYMDEERLNPWAERLLKKGAGVDHETA